MEITPPGRKKRESALAAASVIRYCSEPFRSIVTSSSWNHSVEFPWHFRLILVGVGGGLLALLGTAGLLTPSPLGYGTHQQLGLPPCSFSVFFDIRCPSCGMTTSWAYLVRGQLVPSLQANSGGTLLAVLSLLTGPWFLISGVRGRWTLGRPDERVAIVLAVSIVLVTLVDWCLRLAA